MTERTAVEALRSVVRAVGLETTLDYLSLVCYANGEDLAQLGELASAGAWSDAGLHLQKCATSPKVYAVTLTRRR